MVRTNPCAEEWFPPAAIPTRLEPTLRRLVRENEEATGTARHHPASSASGESLRILTHVHAFALLSPAERGLIDAYNGCLPLFSLPASHSATNAIPADTPASIHTRGSSPAWKLR